MSRRAPRSTLVPAATLFRSQGYPDCHRSRKSVGPRRNLLVRTFGLADVSLAHRHRRLPCTFLTRCGSDLPSRAPAPAPLHTRGRQTLECAGATRTSGAETWSMQIPEPIQQVMFLQTCRRVRKVRVLVTSTAVAVLACIGLACGSDRKSTRLNSSHW